MLAPERLGAFPGAPTAREAIGRDDAGGTWRGIMAPRGIPPEILARLPQAVERVATSAEDRRFLEERGFGYRFAPAEGFRRFLAEQHGRNGEVMGALGLRQRA